MQSKSPFQQKKRSLNGAIQKGLMDIYSNSDGSLPNISHLDVRRKSKWRLAVTSLLGIGLLLAVMIWLIVSLVSGGNGKTDRSINLVFIGPPDIASGDELTYILTYENLESVPLHDLEIIIRYPDGFAFISGNPQASNEGHTVWKIGTLQPNDSATIEIRGKLIGEVGTLKTITATASFRPENFSSTFKESNSFSSQITSSILELDVRGPDMILPEKKLTYTITYTNSSDQDLKGIVVMVTYPSNFIFQEATPAPFQREDDARVLNNRWIIEQLPENQSGEIEISGGYIAEDGQTEASLVVQIGFLDPETENFSLQQEKIVTTRVIRSGLNLDLIINGSTQGQPINFGQTLTYSIVYKNNGQYDLDDVTIALTIDSTIVDWETLEDKHGGVVSGQTISWTKDEISQLDTVRPLDSGSIDISIQVKDSSSINLTQDQLTVHSVAQARLAQIGELPAQDLTVGSSELANTINTDVQLGVEGRYFNDDNIAVGTGPLPPVVGQKTTFRIFWSLTNSLHELRDVTVATTLPEGVSWNDKFLVGAGDLRYSAQNRQVTWSINRLPPNISFDEAYVWFDVAVVPTKAQTGTLLILTEQANFSGADAETDSLVVKTHRAITSNLEDDPIAGGRGLVIDITE